MNGLSISRFSRLAIGARAAARPFQAARATPATPTTSAAAATTATTTTPRISTTTAMAPAYTRTATTAASSKNVPYRRYRKPKPELTHFNEHHGEQIWIHCNIMTSQVIYSHSPRLKTSYITKQFPYQGKMLGMPKLRKDYWRHMALVQFDVGEGIVGRSVFQKLREFRRRHEVEWGAERRPQFEKMGRKRRGECLSDHVSTSVADIAAALSGAGTGNRIWTGDAAEDGTRHNVTIFWSNYQEMKLASAWSDNVTHVDGIPSVVDTIDDIEEVEGSAAAEVASAA